MARTSMIMDSFTRPANTTAYAAADLVANDTTAGNVVPLSFSIPTGHGLSLELRSFRVQKSGTTITNADFDLYIYGSEPTPSVGDNGAFVATNVVASDNASGFLGVLSGNQMLGFSDGGKQSSVQPVTTVVRHRLTPTAKTLYAFLVSTGAYTPASAEVFTVELEVEHIG